jgi:hypothetical protein
MVVDLGDLLKNIGIRDAVGDLQLLFFYLLRDRKEYKIWWRCSYFLKNTWKIQDYISMAMFG